MDGAALDVSGWQQETTAQVTEWILRREGCWLRNGRKKPASLHQEKEELRMNFIKPSQKSCQRDSLIHESEAEGDPSQAESCEVSERC